MYSTIYYYTLSQVAAWLGSSEDSPALEFSIDESHRPVRLRRVVLGYPNASTEFKFDLSLNYRLGGVIQLYSDQKPTLVVNRLSSYLLHNILSHKMLVSWFSSVPQGRERSRQPAL